MKSLIKLNRSHVEQVNWKAVVFFYSLACGLSYGLHFLPNINKGILPVHEIFTYGLGPVVAALLTRYAFPRQQQTITVLGSSPIKAILFVTVPVLLSMFIGVSNRAGQNEHLYGLLLGISGILYGFGEEMGWRGWLQDALRPLPTFWRVTLIGVMHAGWHLTFLPNLSAVSGGQVNGLVVIGILILMAWGMGSLVDTTKSVLVVACAHEFMTIAVHPVSLALTLLVWIWLVRNWRKQWVMRFGHKLVVGLVLIGCFANVPASANRMAFKKYERLTYSRRNKFNKDSELMHTERIEAVRAATHPNTVTLFTLDRPGSFARQTPIRIKYSPFMLQKMEFDQNRPTTDYFQCVALIRDSNMTEPIVP